MLTKLKKFAAANLILAMAATVAAPGVALADNDRGHNRTEVRIILRDVGNHWAKKNVQKLNLEGVIKGYSDGSFQPEKNVTNAEAVVMAVRLLGLEAEANAKMDAELPIKDAGDIPAWAVGYIAVALDKGLIDYGTGYFQPNQAANRMDVTAILVRTLGKQVDRQAADAQLKFTDMQSVNANAQDYIALAVLNNLIKGYEDGSFRPTRPVTRAELATLFARAQERNDIGINKLKLEATLLSVSAAESKISVTTGVYDAVYGDKQDYKVISGAAIYRNDQAVDLGSLKPQDKVELLLNRFGEVVFIDAKEPAKVEEQNIIKGIVTKVEAANKTLKILFSGIAEVQYAVAADAVILREGKPATLNDIQVNDRVEMVQNAQGLISKITAVPGKPPVAINLVKKVKIEVKGKGAKIELEQKLEDGELKAEVELKTPGQKLELKGESAQGFIEKILDKLDLDQAKNPAQITNAVQRVFEPILGTDVEKYEIEIKGPNQKIEIGQVLKDNGDMFRKDFKQDRPINTKINVKIEKNNDHAEEEDEDD
ncbi:MAG: S-layer homology domain-containing protein [Clostridia bacterium]|nr:S-layer homology domain-containing protein [Clostridia bacterium]